MRLAIAGLCLLTACAGPATVDDRLRAACLRGDQPSCRALEQRSPRASEPQVRPARDPALRDTRVGIGVSSDGGVGVGVGVGLGGNLRVGGGTSF